MYSLCFKVLEYVCKSIYPKRLIDVRADKAIQNLTKQGQNNHEPGSGDLGVLEIPRVTLLPGHFVPGEKAKFWLS